MMKVKHITLTPAALSVALAIAGCNKVLPSIAPAEPPSVPVAEVVVQSVTPFVEFTGSLVAFKQVELRPQVAGYIQDVSVPEGRLVEKGNPLFYIDPQEFQAALNGAMARLREAEAALVLAQAEHTRAQQLFYQKVVARDRLDAATASLNAGKAKVDAAKAVQHRSSPAEVSVLRWSSSRVRSDDSARICH